MTFFGINIAMTQSAKSLNGLVRQMVPQLQAKFESAINSVKDGIDVLKAGQDMVSTVLHDVTGQEVTIRDIQKGAKDFDEKWDAFAKEVNDKFNKASQTNQTNILETFAKSHFGPDVYNLGSAVKNELPAVLDGIADYKEAIDSMTTESKTAEEAAKKIQNGVDKMAKATEKVAGSLNEAVKICTGKGYPVLDSLSKISGSQTVANLNKAIGIGVAGASVATAVNQVKEAAKKGDFKAVTDAMAKSANTVNNLLTQLNNIIPGFSNAQIPVQITNSIKRLQTGMAVYDAAGSMVAALVVDASGPITPATLATLSSHFNQNWDKFAESVNKLFNNSSAQQQTNILETLAKNMFGQRVFDAAGVIKRQLPGVLTGVAGVQEALKQFGGNYSDPIDAAKKIRSGVEKMVQSIEKIGQSLNNMVIRMQGPGGKGNPLLDTMGRLGSTKAIQALDTVLRIGGGAAVVVGNAGSVMEAIKNKDIPGAIAAVKKTIEDIKVLTKKGDYSSSSLVYKKTDGGGKNSQDDNTQPSKQNKLLGGAFTDTYVCSGATMRCTQGTSTAKLTVLPSRTVYLTGQPMANISDHISMSNLAPFGRCRSMGFPATASATAANHGTLTPMPCVHNTPFPWMSGKNDYIVKGDPALLKSSTCSCMWGGTISLVDDGQTDTGSADMSRMPLEEFDGDKTDSNR